MFLIAIILAIVFAVLMARAASRPDHFRIERSTVIQAAPSTVFALINDLKNWNAWSPWERAEPMLKRHFTGAPAGVGMVYEWKGEGKAGTGRMQILQSDAPSRIVIQLDYTQPFETHNTVEFLLQSQEGGGTLVTWVMAGPTLFISKVVQVFFDMDNAMGTDLEAGLANLKAAAQSAEAGSEVRPG